MKKVASMTLSPIHILIINFGFITLFHRRLCYSRLMADFSTLFLLILTALTFVIIGMLFIVYLMVLGEREKNKLRAQLASFANVDGQQQCPHSFGYLAGYPLNEPVPDECFGCPRAVECMNRPIETDTKNANVAEPGTPEQQ